MPTHEFTLSRGRRRTLGRLAHVVCPGDVAQLGIEGHIVDELELLLRCFPPLIRGGLLLATFAFEWLAPFAPSSLLRPFSRLPRDGQERWFRRWAHSPIMLIRQFAKTIRGLLAMGYYEHPAVKARIGFAPEAWIGKVKSEREERFAEAIGVHEAAVTAPDPLIPARSILRSQRHGQ